MHTDPYIHKKHTADSVSLALSVFLAVRVENPSSHDCCKHLWCFTFLSFSSHLLACYTRSCLVYQSTVWYSCQLHAVREHAGDMSFGIGTLKRMDHKLEKASQQLTTSPATHSLGMSAPLPGEGDTHAELQGHTNTTTGGTNAILPPHSSRSRSVPRPWAVIVQARCELYRRPCPIGCMMTVFSNLVKGSDTSCQLGSNACCFSARVDKHIWVEGSP